MLASLARRTVSHALGSTLSPAPLLASTTRCFEKAMSTNVAAAAATVGKTNPFPPPDASRGATADLCDVHYTDPVDVVPSEPKVQIAEPIFR